MRVLLVAESLSGNSLGRAYCLWLLCGAAGWECQVVTHRSSPVWAPLRSTEFAESCVVVNSQGLRRALQTCDLAIACKAHPESLGWLLRVRGSAKRPILVDVDDPDIEARLSLYDPFRKAIKRVARPIRTWRDVRLRRIALSRSTLVSNPWLLKRYGGALIPHVREDPGFGDEHYSSAPRVAFVGTRRAHKGIDSLRAAIGRLSDDGFSLTVTDSAPADAKPWENWVGSTSLADGLELVRHADIVALPSLKDSYSRGQLPVKLIDAMLAGRAVVASDLEPMAWALGGAGQLISPGSARDLAAALVTYADPAVRAKDGVRARTRALQMFTVEAVVPAFIEACQAAVGGS